MRSAGSATSLRNAIVLSIVVHACALWLLLVLLGGGGSGGAAEPDGPALPITTIVRRQAPATPARRPARTAVIVASGTAVHAAPRVRTAPQPMRNAVRSHPKPRSVTPTPIGSLVARVLHGPARGFATVAIVAPAAAATAKALLAAIPPPTPAATPTPPPTAAPTVAPTEHPSPPAQHFGGLFSQNYPPALAEPDALAALRSRLSGHLHVRIAIDENGRATDVEPVEPNADAALLAALRSALLALRYVPADCNGLHCEGTLELAY